VKHTTWYAESVNIFMALNTLRR